MGRSQRRKGADGEREAAEFLRASGLFPEARRRCTGEEAQLVDNGRDLAATPGFCFQVSLGARPDVWGKIRESQAAAGPDDIGVAMLRRDRGEWTFHLSAEEFLSLLRRIQVTERRSA